MGGIEKGTTMEIAIVTAIVGAVFGVGGKVAYDQQQRAAGKRKADHDIEKAEKKAADIIKHAKEEADSLERERRKEIKKTEDRLLDREASLDKKLDELDKRAEKVTKW